MPMIQSHHHSRAPRLATKSTRVHHRHFALLPLLLACLLFAAACSSGTKTQSGPSEVKPFSGAAATLVSKLPASLQQLYPGLTDTLLPSAYDKWTAPKSPWKVCFVESFEGNAWRANVGTELQRLTDKYNATGQISSFEKSVSNGKADLENSQIRAFTSKGCSIIMLLPGSTTGDDAAIKDAYDHGIPVVVFAGSVTSPYAINVDSNYFQWGRYQAQQISKQMPKANVLVVEGIAGQPVAVAENDGAKSGWGKNITIVATVNGDWTPSTTKSAVLQALSTHPQKIDAVWTTGSELRYVADAFKQAGKPIPVIAGSPTGDSLAYMKENSTNFFGQATLPVPTADTALDVTLRMLEGQKPKLNTLIIPLPEWGPKSVDTLYKPCMTPASVTPFPVPPTPVISTEDMNGYFANGKKVEGWTNEPPNPCA